MSIPNAIRSFWEEFGAELGFDPSDRFYEVFHFDDNEQGANELANLVLSGAKRATAEMLWEFEAQGKPLPEPGVFSVVTDWPGKPLCVIETTSIAIVPFDEVTEEFAATEGEGEGDKTLRYWRDVHWAYFGRACQRIGRERNLQMPVVCEAFCVRYAPP